MSLPEVTVCNYPDLCHRTEAPVTTEMLNRFENPVAVAELFTSLQQLIEVSDRLDKLKKHFFYGKAVPHMMDSNHPSPERDVLARLNNPKIVRTLHAVLGMATEDGEIVWPLLNHLLSGAELDYTNLFEEAGDKCWYLGLLHHIWDVPLLGTFARNIAKLFKRFPDKFTETHALNRDLSAERAALEA